ncbi:MAG: 6-bladed beta-propeller [Gemmatimonadales bacterium]|nr:MAG: 6-bladed beta-propeller [Gemmatimonadales bacterium]
MRASSPSLRPLRALLCLLTFSAGCGEEVSPGWSGAIVDSAGVTIVRNPLQPIWAPEEGWWVEELFRVGGDESVPASHFGYVADAALGEDGRIYVLDQRAQAVRVFDSDGGLVRSLGGPGEGPGELGRLATSVLESGGEILVVDWVQHRLSRYDVADGRVLPSLPLPHAPAAQSWWESGGDGEVYLRSLSRSRATDGGWSSDDWLLRWVDEARTDTVLRFEYPATGLGARGAPRLSPVVNAPAWAVLEDGRVAWTTLSADELRMVSPAGGVRLVRGASWVPHAPSQAERDALVRGVAARIVMLGGMASAVDEVPVDHPETLPVLTDVRAGPEGSVWVQRAGSLRDAHPMALNTADPPRGWGGPRWEVLDPEGRYLGTVDLPPRFRLMEIRGDTILGVQADRDLVDHVVILNLNRPGNP